MPCMRPPPMCARGHAMTSPRHSTATHVPATPPRPHLLGRLVPAPLLSLALLGLWLLLNRSLSAGHLLLGTVVALAIPLLTAGLRPLPVRIRKTVHIPLDVRDPNALAVLAMIVCITPGTAWAEISLDRSMLLLHVLELDDPATVIADVKQRYE
eukprot:gene48872-66342_t